MPVCRLATGALVAAMLAVSSSRARACDTEAGAGPESSCVVTKFRGAPGVWFRLAESQELLAKVRLVPELALQVQKYSDMEMATTAEITALRGALDAEKAANAKLTAATVASQKEASAAQADAAQARQELDRWWRSPVIWLAIGAAAGALTGLALAAH
jgi:hypothetical protein